jgi:hypothetical protein
VKARVFGILLMFVVGPKSAKAFL